MITIFCQASNIDVIVIFNLPLLTVKGNYIYFLQISYVQCAHKLFLEANEDKRTKCVVYTRVMGYHRPVESFNLGKISLLVSY